MKPDLPPEMRHGTVWFDVCGFGITQRDFLVSDRDLLVNNPKLAIQVAEQVMLLDRYLPHRKVLCRPTRIDIVGNTLRRVYDLPKFDLVLEQPL